MLTIEKKKKKENSAPWGKYGQWSIKFSKCQTEAMSSIQGLAKVYCSSFSSLPHLLLPFVRDS